MKEVVNVLMLRDSISKEEAEERVLEARRQIDDSGYDYSEVEDIMLDELGLELDYLFDVLFG